MLERLLVEGASPSLTRFEREAMSERYPESIRESSRTEHLHRYKGSRDGRERKLGRNSAEDPAIASSKSDRPVSTNSRPHPRAELNPNSVSSGSQSSSTPRQASNHVSNHTPTKCGTKRKRTSEENEEEVVWTEHLSSSGRIYYFNEKLKKSQWERPKGHIKKLKQDSSALSSNQKHKSKSHNTARSSSSSNSAARPSSSVGSTSDSSSKLLHPDSKGPHRGSGGGFSDARALGDRDSERGSSSRRHHLSSSMKHGSRSRSGSKSPRSRYSSREKTPSRSSRVSTPHTTSSSGRSAYGSSVQTSPLTPTSIRTPGSTIPSSVAVISPPAGTPHMYHADHSLRASVGESTTTPVHFGSVSYSVATPTPPHHARHKLNYAHQQATPTNGPSSYGQELTGASTPVTPIHGYQGPAGNLTSPQYPQATGPYGDNLGGLHPLQQALLLKQQVKGFISQDPVMLPEAPIDAALHMARASAIPSHVSTTSSLPGSPFPLSSPHCSLPGTPVPLPYYASQAPPLLGIQPITPVQVIPQPMFGAHLVPTGGAQGMGYVQTQEASLTGPVTSTNILSLRSPTLLQTPMARLGYSDADGSRYSQFPDVGDKETVTQTPINQFFSRALLDTWLASDQVQKQIESCNHEYLSRRCTESIALSGKLSWRKLALERSRVNSTSRSERIEGLRNLVKELDKRF